MNKLLSTIAAWIARRACTTKDLLSSAADRIAETSPTWGYPPIPPVLIAHGNTEDLIAELGTRNAQGRLEPHEMQNLFDIIASRGGAADSKTSLFAYLVAEQLELLASTSSDNHPPSKNDYRETWWPLIEAIITEIGRQDATYYERLCNKIYLLDHWASAIRDRMEGLPEGNELNEYEEQLAYYQWQRELIKRIIGWRK